MNKFTFGKKTVDVNPRMYGLFLEDINYGADGGLYGELLQNRSFDFFPTKLYDDISPLFAWVWENADISVASAPLNGLGGCAHVSANAGGGIYNTGYDGIVIKNGEKYDFSLYARNYDGNLEISLRSGKRTLAKGEISASGGDWKKYELTLTASGDASDARLYITLPSGGDVDLDLASLFPEDTYKGRKNGLRRDLAEALADVRPGFFRFPGGCIVEGNGLSNRYRWKDTVGDVSERKINWNRWQNAFVGPVAPEYFQSYGLGFYEYFLFCEDIGAEPLPVLNCGMGCQYQCDETVPLEELGEYIRDALDLIEFANGGVDTKWGAKRAAMGHAEPFNLKYLGIGNEQWDEKYFVRYEAFQKVLAEKHPEILLATTSGPDVWSEHFDKAREWLKDKTPEFAYLVDEHYYVNDNWMYEQSSRYDSYPRGGAKIFVGEYACHLRAGQPRPNSLRAALAEAAMMTGFERNADVVHFAAYAPLLAKKGKTQWTPDLIYFDNESVVLTPSYYVQKMFAHNVPTYSIEFSFGEDADIFACAGFDEKTGETVVKIVNRSEDAKEISLDGAKTIKAQYLTAENIDLENTYENKTAVEPKTETASGGNYTLRPHSFTVLRF